MAEAALHSSLTVTPLNALGTAAWLLASGLALGMGEQFTVGAVVSVTVKIVVQVALLPAASVAVTVIVWPPKPTSVPAAEIGRASCRERAQIPAVAVSLKKTLGTAPWQLPPVLTFGMGEH